LIASASRDKTVRIWETATEVVRTLAVDTSDRPVVAFSPDGRYILTAALDRPLTMWDLATLTQVHTFPAADAGVFSIAFSADGKLLAANRGLKVVVWQLPSGDVVQTMEGHTINVLSVAFSPDGRSIASASADESIKLWDVATGALVRTFTGHQGSVVFVGFAPDASYIVSGGDTDNLIELREPATGKLIRIFEGEHLLTCVAASADGKWIASGVEHIIKLWSPLQPLK
jgi:WD40 repeat protein